MELTNLELNKKIAEIEGADVIHNTENNKLWIKIAGIYGGNEYNPVLDWNITGPLMVKHKIDFFHVRDAYCASDNKAFTVNSKDPQRAILLAIVAKYEAVK